LIVTISPTFAFPKKAVDQCDVRFGRVRFRKLPEGVSPEGQKIPETAGGSFARRAEDSGNYRREFRPKGRRFRKLPEGVSPEGQKIEL